MTPARLTPASRRGASLTEVLMALMIMAIGLSSIFTLFPLSIVRSVRATQLTNSQLMYRNVEQLFRVKPDYFAVHYRSGTNNSTWPTKNTYSLGEKIDPGGNFLRITDFARFRNTVSVQVPFLNYQVKEAWDNSVNPRVPATNGNRGATVPQWPIENNTVAVSRFR